MKRVLFSLVLTLAAFGAVFAQDKGEFGVGYQFLRQDVKFEQPSLAFDENTDSHGFYVNATRYFGGSATRNGVVGLTGDVGVNIDNNEANLVTALGGVTLKARNAKYVQPFVNVLGGVARQHVNRQNILDTSDVSTAYALGGGVDIKPRSESKAQIRIGANYLNTGFAGERQNAVVLRAGLVF